MPRKTLSLKLGFNLSEKQRDIVNLCKIGNGVQYVAVCTGRQIGKTTLDNVVAIQWSVEQKGFNTGFFMPVYKQCKKVFRSLERMLKPLGKKVEFNKTELLITFWNGSTIHFFTSENDNCRGETFDAIIVDEACFVKQDIWEEAIEPTVAVSLSKKNALGLEGFCGKVLMTSTPKTKNWFYSIVNGNDDKTVVRRFTSEEGGLISKQVLDRIKKRIPELAYRNEYLGEFLDSGNGLFKYLDCVVVPGPEKTPPKEEKNGHCAALDIGSKEDYTVLTIQDRNGKVIFVDRWRHMEYNVILESAKKRLIEFGSPICWIETNGVGQMPFEILRKIYGKVKEWNTTASNKTDLITKLQVDFNTKAIQIPDLQFLKDELDYFTCEWKGGKPHFEGSNGFHDDCVMSLAICNYNRDKIASVSAYSITKTKKSNY
jgi:hypothetical protein